MIQEYQQRLLDEAHRIAVAEQRTLAPAITQAFLATPRHLFIQRYRTWESAEWQVVTAENLAEHLPTLYGNYALALYGEGRGIAPSTISQPTLVLHMLELLQLVPGQQVFELGAGSGWNAALLGQLVGPAGQVYSVEIIPAVAQQATANVAALGLTNVHIIADDGGAGYAPGAPYDRAIFTAGAFDLPRHFYQQLRPDGLLLLVLKVPGGGDMLCLLRHVDDHFVALEMLPVGFVPMTGRYAMPELQALPLTDLPEWEQLQGQVVSDKSFWWGGRNLRLLWRTQEIRAFLAIVEPQFRIFTAAGPEEPASAETAGAGATGAGASDAETEEFFGLWDAAANSLVIARNNRLLAYGSLVAQERLLAWLHHWVDWGMPSAANFSLQIYPADVTVPPAEQQWIVRRNESQFVWQLQQ
ncbi:MAG: hypothetical protein R3C14_53780 [Caldilineaceae bacterium]